MKDFAGKVAVVTGASSGIGAELARQLAGRGMRVALVARRQERLEDLADSIAGDTMVVPCDVANREAVSAAAMAVVDAWGGIDLLINNAGYGRHTQFVDHDIDDIERMMATNYMGTVYWIRATIDRMRERGNGAIVNVSSFAGRLGQPDEAAYSATKFAVTGLSEGLVYELAPLGIHVMCVHPVLVRTEMFTDEVMERMPPRTRDSFIEPEEFVRATLEALERGEHDVTVPRRFSWIYVLKSLFPRMLGKKVGQVKMDALKTDSQP